MVFHVKHIGLSQWDYLREPVLLRILCPSLPAGWGRSAGVHFEWPKWTKSHLGRSPLRTSLGSAALDCRSNPNRPREKLRLLFLYIRCRSTFQRGWHLPQKGRAGHRWWLPVGSRARRCIQRSTKALHREYQRQRRCEDRQSFLPQRRWGMLQRQARRPGGYLGGNALGDSFPDFSSLRNRAQRSVPGRGAAPRRTQGRRTGFSKRKTRRRHRLPVFFEEVCLSKPAWRPARPSTQRWACAPAPWCRGPGW